MTRVHTTYNELMTGPTKDWGEEAASFDDLVGIKADIQKLEEIIKRPFDEHCKTGLYKLTVHSLDYILEDLERVGSLDMSNSYPLDRYNLHIKRAYRTTSGKRRRRLEGW